MTIRKILTEPNKILRQKSNLVDKIDKNIQDLKTIINRMNQQSLKGGGKYDRIGYSGGGRFQAWGFRFVK